MTAMATIDTRWPGLLRFQAPSGGFRYPGQPEGGDTADRGHWILALGFVSLVICPLGVFAWLAGNACLDQIEDGRLDPVCESNARAGRLLGKIAVGMLAIKLTVIFPMALALWIG
jgi:hypothetical protein